MKKLAISLVVVLALCITSGCSSAKGAFKSNKNTQELNILATTDLHSDIPLNMEKYIKAEHKKDKNLTVVDAGDFYDTSADNMGDMQRYFDMLVKEKGKDVGEVPVVKEMKECGYDTVTLGNHEFISDMHQLKKIKSDFKKEGIKLLSANTYNQDGTNFTDPYYIKNIKTPKGNIKLGILGLTIKEVGENSQDLKDIQEFKGKLYMNDMVKDAQKYVKELKSKKVDAIILVAHSGEAPKHPRHPGNRVQELAKNVAGVDVVVAGHTHEQIAEHKYKNKSGNTVIVTQSGKHGDGVSKINLKFEKENGRWKIVDKSSSIKQIDLSLQNKTNDNFYKLIGGLLDYDQIDVNKKIEKYNKQLQISNLNGDSQNEKGLKMFKWDKMYVFKTNTPREQIYKTVGYKWRNITETYSDDQYQIVCMNDNKVVAYGVEKGSVSGLKLKFDKSEYKNGVITILPGKNDKFIVNKKLGHLEYTDKNGKQKIIPRTETTLTHIR